MSDFRIIKCKSCDAALVELQGEKIRKCVQCGYNFALKVNKKAKRESVIEQTFEKLIDKSNAPISKNQTSTQNAPQLKTSTKTKSTVTNGKKQGSIIGTIIKWYIIIFIASKVIQEFF